MELRRSSIHGLGAFARKDIPKGTRIIEYVGEKIGNREADRRYDDAAMKRHHTFLFILNDRTCVDAAFDGNESRFLNHSCSPNCEAVISRGHIWIEATQEDSGRHGARLRLSVRGRSQVHRGGPALLRVQVRRAKLPRHDREDPEKSSSNDGVAGAARRHRRLRGPVSAGAGSTCRPRSATTPRIVPTIMPGCSDGSSSRRATRRSSSRRCARSARGRRTGVAAVRAARRRLRARHRAGARVQCGACR